MNEFLQHQCFMNDQFMLPEDMLNAYSDWEIETTIPFEQLFEELEVEIEQAKKKKKQSICGRMQQCTIL